MKVENNVSIRKSAPHATLAKGNNSLRPILYNTPLLKSPEGNLLRVYFAGRLTDEKTQIALRAQTELKKHIENQTDLSEKDLEWLNPLFKALGTTCTIKELNSSHTHPWSKQKFDHKEEMLKTITAILAATAYKPIKKEFEDYSIDVHNNDIYPMLKRTYTQKTFDELFKTCEQNGVFDIKFDRYGFPITTETDQNEDAVMRKNVWVTDTVRDLRLVKDKYPKRYLPILKKLAKFYENETPEFKRVCQNPHTHGEEYKKEGINQFHGIGHSFNPASLKADRKFLAMRFESQGIYMKELSTAMLKGLLGNENVGIISNDDIDDKMINSLVMIAMYLHATEFPYAKDCGNWENTIMKGVTSDTEIVKSGLKALRKIIISTNPQAKIVQYRMQTTYDKTKSDWFKGTNGWCSYPTSFQKLVDQSILLSEKRLQENHMLEHPKPKEYNNRAEDAALAFVPLSAVFNKTDTIADVEENLKLLNSLRKLVKPNGMIRYSTDDYENLNYELALNAKEKLDFAGMKKFNPRPKGIALKEKAQWFMVSDMSRGYGVQVKKLIRRIKYNDGRISDQERELLERAYSGQVEYINRAYARITGLYMTKANGRPCPSWQVPESYMAVSSLDDIGTTKAKTYLPGTNTPLTWAKASLYDASKLMAKNLKELENLGIEL